MSIVLDGSNVSTTGVPNSGTAVASTSGTSIDFTGIPAGTKRITVMFSGVSTNGTSSLLIQTGSGSITTTGYTSASVAATSVNTVASTSSTSGNIIYFSSAANTLTGAMVLMNVTGNAWISTHTYNYAGWSVTGGGNVSLSGALDRVRITTTGSDTFDAGSINILYE